MERGSLAGMLTDLRRVPGGAGWYFIKHNADFVNEVSQIFPTREDAWKAYFEHRIEWTRL